jgi:hypothetical protein
MISGFSILTNKHARTAATLLGVAIAAVVLFIYLPMPVVAVQPSEANNAVNYIGDITLFAGSIFLLAATIPVGFRSASAIREPGHASDAGG